jgi:hypothetical protein
MAAVLPAKQTPGVDYRCHSRLVSLEYVTIPGGSMLKWPKPWRWWEIRRIRPRS